SAGHFWSAILRALAGAVQDDEADELAVIESSAHEAPQNVPARLAQLLSRQDFDTCLVLEDLHAVTGIDVHEQLIEFVAAAASRLHLIVLTRHDPPWPLHRLRLDGLLENLRVGSLAFDEDEAAELFALLGLSVSPVAVHRAVRRTQGWAAGLRLVALGAQASADPEQFVESVSGRDGYIADYLLREVYEGLAPEWQEFLARISVADEVSAELAETLGGGVDSGLHLSELARQNAFVQPLEERAGWYRLHPLLLDFLRSRATGKPQRRALHGLAARWFTEQDEPAMAIRHALAAGDWGLAGDLASTHVVSWAVRRPPAEFKRLLEQVPREVILTQPGLAISLASVLTMSGEPTDVAELVAAARTQLSTVAGSTATGPTVTRQQRRRYDFLLNLVDFGPKRFTGDFQAVLDGCRRIPTDPVFLAGIGLADWDAIRTLLINNVGTAELWTGDIVSARDHLAEAARVDGLRAATALPTLNAQAHLAYLHWMRGELRAAEEVGQRAIDGFVRLEIPQALQACCAYLALSGVAIDRNDLPTADRWLSIANDSASETQTEFAAELMSARLLAARSQWFDAIAAVRLARERAQTGRLPATLIAQACLLEAHFLLLAGNSVSARETAESIDVPPDRVTDPASTRARVEAQLTRATREPTSRRSEPALDELESALTLAASELLRQPFLARTEIGPLLNTRIELGTSVPDFAADLLERMAAQDVRVTTSPNVIFVPLPARETNILRYLATTMSTKEIAQALYVSVNTVKTHQRSIHQKLGASDRRAAVTHARSLGML
ncbi:MAG: LuxR C-terminal-related transcriptional regulator, partial [Microlunatus sp.]|nr:LuxR C-terminal-related transcriptional regulator [Microlunatus sp.]